MRIDDVVVVDSGVRTALAFHKGEPRIRFKRQASKACFRSFGIDIEVRKSVVIVKTFGVSFKSLPIDRVVFLTSQSTPYDTAYEISSRNPDYIFKFKFGVILGLVFLFSRDSCHLNEGTPEQDNLKFNTIF